MMSDDILMHYGTKEHSGRYPWGSGENPYQRLDKGSIRARVKEMSDAGMSQKDIAKALGMTTTVLRQRITLEKNEAELQTQYRIRELKDKGWSNVAIAKELGCTEGTVRNHLKESRQQRINSLRVVSDQLKSEVDKKRYLDVGAESHLALGCTKTKLDSAISLLKDEGYELHNIWVPQLGTDHNTNMNILCVPGTEKKFLYNNLDKIHEIDETRIQDVDGSFKLGMAKPKSVDRSRIFVRYREDGGLEKDGTIELRRGVDDISLGKANYAQVRIAVDDKMYMKGMAYYSDDIPKGYDIIYNSNKPKGSPDYDKVFKPMDTNSDNPFGATIKGLTDDIRPEDKKELKLTQRYYIDKDGNKQLSCINIVNEEGAWDNWSRSLASQFLSKQPVPLAKRQLDISYKQSVSELDDILKLTEPTVKKKLLLDFAEGCDAAASELKAAALPRQRSQVILPLTTLKDNECYAPNFKNGEHVVLVRYPHQGTFEIPELVVNNNNREGKKIMTSNPMDAIGINIKTADKLSGADFDGDTVLVIPCDNVKIKTSELSPSLKKELEDFDPKAQYPLPKDAPKMTNRQKGIEMGSATNLITDMTLLGASNEEIVRATKHAQVVIDAQKHHLDYKKSALDNNIGELKKKYQGRANAGAATIISRSTAEAHIPEVKDYYKIDPITGEKILKETGNTKEKIKKETDPVTGKTEYIHTGKYEPVTTKTNRMATVKDAMALTSDGQGGHPMETVYAVHANNMKALANRARREYLAVQDREYNPTAAKTYAKEVESLETKYLLARKNAPRERQATLVGNSRVRAELAAHPEYKDDPDRMKKLRGQALSSARAAVGARKEEITFTDREWEAIQSGAIKKTKLNKIINEANKDEVRQRSMPKVNIVLTPSKIATIKAMSKYGYTQDEIAQYLGLSVSSVNNALTNR